MKESSRSRTALAAFLVFFGITVSIVSGAAQAVDTFTIAVIPDTQNYVDNTKPQPGSLSVFKAETQYLADHKDAMSLVFVTHVGDVVEHGDGTNGAPGNTAWGAGAEWDRAKCAMDILAASGMPFGMSPGNHDYDNYNHPGRGPLRSNVMWNKQFRVRLVVLRR